MYKALSIEEIQKEMLENISDDYIKGVGTFTTDLTKTVAIEAHNIEKKIEEVFGKLDIYNLSGDELERQVYQRKGVKRKVANPAKGSLRVYGNGIVSAGSIFETENGIRFKSIYETNITGISDIEIVATESGTSGNVGANSITFMPVTIQGITAITNPNQTYDGYDAETDDSLRERYLIEIQKPATSGNVYHYMQWARECVGVGDSRIFPLWNGNNTVEIMIIDDSKMPANEELISRVQTYIDPIGMEQILPDVFLGENIESTWGTGSGQAPIGAYCTISTPSPVDINVVCNAILESGYGVEDVKPLLELEIKNHLREIAFKKNYVSYALLGSLILNVKGIVEWSYFTMNSQQENVLIGSREVAVLGNVIINV